MPRFQSMMKRAVLVTIVLGLGLLSPACDSDTDVGPNGPGPTSDDTPALFERDFPRTEGLRASLSSTVLLQLESASQPHPDDTGTPGVDVVPYRLQDEQTVHVCLRDLGSSVAGATLRNARDEVVLEVAHGSDCASVTLPAGDYTVSVTRATTGEGATDAVAPVFLHPMTEQSPPALQAAIGVQCTDEERETRPTSMPSNHTWYVTTATGFVSGFEYPYPIVYVEPLKSTLAAHDLGEFVSVKRTGDGLAELRSASSGKVMTGGRKGSAIEELVMYEANVDPDRISAWTLLGNARPFTFDPVVVQTYPQPAVGWSNQGDVIITRSLVHTERTPLTFAMRFVPDAASMGALRSGEVALFERCDYGGKAVVLNTANAFPPNINGAAAYLGGPVKSIKLSCSAILDAYMGPNYSGHKERIVQNRRCFDYGDRLISANVKNVTSIVIETKSCEYCNLQGINLQGATLPTLDVSHSNLTGARLDRANLQNAFFSYADLTDASFAFADLTGANLGGGSVAGFGPGIAHRASFDHANLTKARLAFADFSRAKFDDATFRETRIISSTFDSASFNRTSFVGISEITDTALTNTDLTNAYFANPTFKLPPGQALVADPCAQPRNDAVSLTKLAGTRFGFKQIPVAAWRFIDFTDARGDASAIGFSERDLSRQNLCGLKLGGLVFERWKLAETKLANSDLARTTFRNADLRYADLTGAVMSGASVV